MRAYSLSHLGDPELRHGLLSLVAQDRATTATLLAHIAEFDARKLYLPAAYPSMFAYCVHELRLSEDAAYNRIRAARLARQFPDLFEALADGRLHLGAIGLLAPYLTPENADELLAAAVHRTKSEIEALLAERFPRMEALGLVTALPASPPRTGEQHAPGHVEGPGPRPPGARACQLAPGRVGTLAPVAPERYLLEVTVGRSTHDKLQYVRDLLGHQVPSGDLARVLDRALDALVEKLEKRKFAATGRPRRSGRPSGNPRHIPACVKRAVWERDGGQCTFVSETGHRCPARQRLEFDHIEEVARGGRASVAGIRLRCRAHNQYGAELAFGAGFMREKRDEARRRAEARRKETEARRRAEARARTAAEELITPLRLLGFSAEEARHAAAQCEDIREAPLEQRLRRALSRFHARGRRSAPAAPSPGPPAAMLRRGDAVGEREVGGRAKAPTAPR